MRTLSTAGTSIPRRRLLVPTLAFPEVLSRPSVSVPIHDVLNTVVLPLSVDEKLKNYFSSRKINPEVHFFSSRIKHE
jgi:hypothetical protein